MYTATFQYFISSILFHSTENAFNWDARQFIYKRLITTPQGSTPWAMNSKSNNEFSNPSALLKPPMFSDEKMFKPPNSKTNYHPASNQIEHWQTHHSVSHQEKSSSLILFSMLVSKQHHQHAERLPPKMWQNHLLLKQSSTIKISGNGFCINEMQWYVLSSQRWRELWSNHYHMIIFMGGDTATSTSNCWQSCCYLLVFLQIHIPTRPLFYMIIYFLFSRALIRDKKQRNWWSRSGDIDIVVMEWWN